MSDKLLQNVRQDVRGRTAAGLVDAQLRLTDWNYVNRFRRPTRGARGNGLRFEAKVAKTLEEKHLNFLAGPVFGFKTIYSAKNICIPDGLIFLEDEVLILEMKLRHTVDAWYQLTQLYSPVIGKVFSSKRLRLLEICSSYDPVERFPEPYLVVSDLETFIRTKGARIGVWLWGR